MTILQCHRISSRLFGLFLFVLLHMIRITLFLKHESNFLCNIGMEEYCIKLLNVTSLLFCIKEYVQWDTDEYVYIVKKFLSQPFNKIKDEFRKLVSVLRGFIDENLVLKELYLNSIQHMKECLLEQIQKADLFLWFNTLYYLIVEAAGVVKGFVMGLLFDVRQYGHRERMKYFNLEEKSENKDKCDKLLECEKSIDNDRKLDELNTIMKERIVELENKVIEKENQIENMKKEITAKDKEFKESDKWWFDEINRIKRQNKIKIERLLDIIKEKDSQFKIHEKVMQDKTEEWKKLEKRRIDELNEYKGNKREGERERERVLRKQKQMEQHIIEVNFELEELKQRMKDCNCAFGKEDGIAAEVEKETMTFYEDKIQEQNEILQIRNSELSDCQGKLKETNKQNQALSRKIKDYESMLKEFRLRERRLQNKLKDVQKNGLEQVEECRNVYEMKIARMSVMESKISEMLKEINSRVLNSSGGGNRFKTPPPSSSSNISQDQDIFAGKEVVFAIIRENIEKCLQNHRYKDALENLEILEERESCNNNRQIKVKKARCLLHLDRELEAKQVIDLLLEENDQDYDAICEMGFYYLSIRQNDKARSIFQYVLKEKRSYPRLIEGLSCLTQQIQMQRSVAEELDGHIANSLLLLNKAAKRGSFFRWLDMDIYFRRGMVNFQLTNYEAAIADFSRVINDCSDDHKDALLWRAFSYAELGQFDEAHREFMVLSKKNGGGGIFKVFAQEAAKLKAMAPKGCPYNTLGLNVSCYRHEIQRTYEDLLQKHHNDVVFDQKNDTQQFFSYIEFAKDMLLDDEKRSRYNALLRSLKKYSKAYLTSYRK